MPWRSPVPGFLDGLCSQGISGGLYSQGFIFPGFILSPPKEGAGGSRGGDPTESQKWTISILNVYKEKDGGRRVTGNIRTRVKGD